MTSSNRMCTLSVGYRSSVAVFSVSLFVVLLTFAWCAAVDTVSTTSPAVEPNIDQDGIPQKFASCSPQDPACLDLQQVVVESAHVDETPTTAAAPSINEGDVRPLPQDFIPLSSQPEIEPTDDNSASPAIDCGIEGNTHVMSDGSVTCNDAAAAPASVVDVTGEQYYDVTPSVVTSSGDGSEPLPVEFPTSETSPDASAASAREIPDGGGVYGDEEVVASMVTAVAQPVENEYRYVDEEHEYPNAAGSDDDVGDYYDVRDDYVLRVNQSDIAPPADGQEVAYDSRYPMNVDDRNDGVWNSIVDDSTLYEEGVWKQATTELPAAETYENGNEKEPAAMAIRHPVASAQRWFEGQGEFSAFVVYTWLAIASASLVIVIILVRYRHEVSVAVQYIKNGYIHTKQRANDVVEEANDLLSHAQV